MMVMDSNVSEPESRQTPSLPNARPRSDRLRCGGRESKFLAVSLTVSGAAGAKANS